VQAHRARARMGLQCLTVRVSDRQVRCLISDGYLALENSVAAAAVAIALETWIADNLRLERGDVQWPRPRLAACTMRPTPGTALLRRSSSSEAAKQ
jgi:hypothetical protein